MLKNIKPMISVVIPSYNRGHLIKASLESLIPQSISHNQFEVIVVDDGSTDNTGDVCEDLMSKLPLKYLRLKENSGISAAKNLGVFAARADIIFFFDDDDIADRNLLEEHLRSHQQYPQENIAILGYTRWGKEVEVTHVMNYITKIGQFLFSYESLKDGQELDFSYFWGGRSSCKKSFLTKHGVFNPKFWNIIEDIELGYRLSKFGLKVIFNKKAVSFMVRPISFEQFCLRSEKQGKGNYLFSRIHPEPVVQQYCMAYDAEEKWKYVEKHLISKKQRVQEIENIIAKKGAANFHGDDQIKLITELHDLYYWSFISHKLKGFVESSKAIDTEQNNHLYSQIDQCDLDYFKSKRGNPVFLQIKNTNILIIDRTLPWFDRASGSLRLFQILLQLKSLGYHITFIAVDGLFAEQYAPILQRIGIEVYAGDPSAIEAMGKSVIGVNLDFENILKAGKYDYAVLSFWDVAEYYLPLIKKYSPSTQIIIDSVDIHFVRELREAELNKNTELEQNALKRKKRELSIYNRADMLWVITNKDKDFVRPFIKNIPIEIVPNIHEIIDYRQQFENRSDILFIGNFNHPPNIDAVKYFCKEIFPKILPEIPSVKLIIAGNNPPYEIKLLASDNIIVTGYVQDLTTYLKNSRLSVSPLRYGAGMKGKIGEALSWGIPVVTTTVGAEGMDLKNNYHALISDDPRNFAADVIRLYKDKELWNRLSENGRKKVFGEWSPAVVGKKIKSIFNKSENKSEPLASIIILTYNGLEYTKQCFDSVHRNTSYPHEIIFVDNASSDGTVEYLKEIENKYRNIRLILNSHNCGFPLGNNQGMAVANGEYIILLNNDVIVSENWLEKMIECAESDKRIGIAGPMTNHISGPQCDLNANYKSISELPHFARSYSKLNAKKWVEYPRITGFCMLIKKELISKIGGLDPIFGKGNFEDDDFCLRSYLSGFKSVIAGNVFIHHYGGKSFRLDGEKEYLSQLNENKNVFSLKWGTEAENIWNTNCKAIKQNLNIPLNSDGVEEAYLRGVNQIEKQNYTDALKYFNIADRLYNSKIYLNKEMSESLIHMRKGDCFLMQELLQEAKEEYEIALQSDPASAEACYKLGLCFEYAGLTDSALKMFECALELNPDWQIVNQKVKSYQYSEVLTVK